MRRVIYMAILIFFAHHAFCEDAVAAAEKKYNAAIEQAKKDYVTALKAEMTRLTKAGDLDGALKVRDKIATLEKQPDVQKPNSADPATPQATKLLIWNNTDGQGDHGADQVKVEFFKGGASVWSKTIDTLWKEGEESKTEVDVPWTDGIEKIRVTVLRPHKADAGLAELELMVGDKNILKGKTAKASSEWDNTGHSTDASKLTDGDRNGGWRARGRTGWVEIDLTTK